MEAPDECGHHGDLKNKIFSIEEIDEKVVKHIKERLDADGEEYSMLICPDHPTPLSTMTHAKDPVPFLIYRSNKNISNGASSYSEEEAIKTGFFLDSGIELMQRFLEK